MKVTNITPNIDQEIKFNKTNDMRGKQQSFTGISDAMIVAPEVFLRFLDTNQAWGANLVDIGSMVIPRTAYDMSHRGFATGMETARRESTGTFNHSMVGVYGTVLGSMLALTLNNAYDIKAHKIFANNDTLNILGNNWYKALHSGASDPLKEYLNNVISEIKVYNPTNKKAVDGMVNISEDTQKLVVDRLYKLIKDPNSKNTIGTKDVDYMKRLITANTGGEKSVILEGFAKGNKILADNTLTTLLENIHNVTKVFNKEKVTKSFTEAVDFDSVQVLKLLKRLNIKRLVCLYSLLICI